MLIDLILEKDTINCYEAISHDTKLQELEEDFYSIMREVPIEVRNHLECVFSAFASRTLGFLTSNLEILLRKVFIPQSWIIAKIVV